MRLGAPMASSILSSAVYYCLAEGLLLQPGVLDISMFVYNPSR